MGLFSQNIAVMRPLAQATSLADSIRAAGGIPFICPTMDIKPSEQGLVQLSRVPACEWIIFISQNAVLHSIAVLESLPWFSSASIAAIGPATAVLIQAHGCVVSLCPQTPYNTASLLAEPGLQEIKNAKILLVTGHHGKPDLVKGLGAREADVFEVPVYSRCLPNWQKVPDALWRQDIFVSTSAVGLENLATLLIAFDAHELMHKPLLVISPAMALLAKQKGFTSDIIIAENATNAAILKALTQWAIVQGEKR